MDIIKEYLGLPKNCYINVRMPKKVFIDNPEFDLKKEEKTILKEYVENIYLEYSLKPQFLNIERYEDDNIRYEEIEIIRVKINEPNKYKKVCELIQKYIQYPILILIECEENIKFNVALKKINKIEKEKLAIDDMIYTDWININDMTEKDKSFLQSLSLDKLRLNNIFTIYEDLVNILKSFEVAKYKETFEVKSIEETTIKSKVLDNIVNIESEIVSLRNIIKKETNIGTKVELNIKIKKLQQKVKVLKANLN